MIIEYKGSVNTPAGFRSVYIRANAEKISDKRVKVLSVLTIDDISVGGYQSITGAKRQTFNSDYTAKNEVDKIKIISKLYNIE
jgi:hypothetical protein